MWSHDSPLGRQDLSELASLTVGAPSFQQSNLATREREDVEKEDEDGMEHLDEEVRNWLAHRTLLFCGLVLTLFLMNISDILVLTLLLSVNRKVWERFGNFRCEYYKPLGAWVAQWLVCKSLTVRSVVQVQPEVPHLPSFRNGYSAHSEAGIKNVRYDSEYMSRVTCPVKYVHKHSNL